MPSWLSRNLSCGDMASPGSCKRPRHADFSQTAFYVVSGYNTGRIVCVRMAPRTIPIFRKPCGSTVSGGDGISQVENASDVQVSSKPHSP